MPGSLSQQLKYMIFILLNVMFDPLQNIFLGEDIRKQLPRESADFDDVNAKWKVIMTRLNKDRNALRGTHHEGKEQLDHPVSP